MISIIIPIYKAERFLDRCIQSVLAQTYHDFELILIDDGSPDDSGLICDKYAFKDKRITVIHKENGGPSESRNAGLEVANGKWIVFVDADDYVETDYLEELISCNPNEDEAMIVIQDNRYVTTKGDDVKCERLKYDDNLIKIGKNQDIILKYRLLHHFAIYGKLFSNRIIKENKLHFNPIIKHCEDGLFIHQYYLSIDKIFISSAICYNYVIPSEDKFSISQNVCRSNESIYELAKAYSIVCYRLIEKFGLEKASSYATEVMDMFVNRYRQVLLMGEYDSSPIRLTTLKYYSPKDIDAKLFKFVTCHFCPFVYRIYVSIRTSVGRIFCR